MNADEIIKKAVSEFTKLSKVQVDGVCGISKSDNGWTVSLEGLERRSIPDTMDVLGLYEIRFDNDGNFMGFERKKLRKRGETEED